MKTEIRKIARKSTNSYLKSAHTSTLARLLKTFNWHFKTENKNRQQLLELVRIERNRIIWGDFATA